MEILRKRLTPNRFDAAILVGCLLILVAFFGWLSLRHLFWIDLAEPVFMVTVVACSIVSIAIASCIALGRAHKFRCIVLLLIAILGCLIPPLLIDLASIQDADVNPLANRFWEKQIESFRTDMIGIGVIPLGIFVAVLVLLLSPSSSNTWSRNVLKFSND